VIYVVYCDLGGSLPAYIINQVSQDIPMTVEKLDVRLSGLRSDELKRYDKPIPAFLDFVDKQSASELNDVNESLHGDQTLDLDEDYFASIEYKQLLIDNGCEKDKRWIKRRLQLDNDNDDDDDDDDNIEIDKDNNRKKDYVKDFVKIPDNHKYAKEVQEAIDLFHKWRGWKNGSQWQERSMKSDLRIYSNSDPNEKPKSGGMDILKGETTADYPSPVIAGLLMNPSYRKSWDSKLDEIRVLEKLSPYCNVVYISVKMPMIITYRDMVTCVYIYTFPDGQFVIGSCSVNHPQEPPRSTRVRGWISNAVWHVFPHPADSAKCHVVYYAQMSLGGSIPDWVVNQAAVDIPVTVNKLLDFANANATSVLSKPGACFISPYYLHLLGLQVPRALLFTSALRFQNLGIVLPPKLRRILDEGKSQNTLDEKETESNTKMGTPKIGSKDKDRDKDARMEKRSNESSTRQSSGVKPNSLLGRNTGGNTSSPK
ncbi:hypothetical protein RFI_33148, partial [Reticulomyxa filosa]